MKLSEYKGEKAIEVLGDLLEPATSILTDDNVVNAIKADKPKIIVAKEILKSHAKEVIEILAILDDEDVNTYEVNFLTLPKKLIDLMNDEAIIDLFTSQGQNEE